MAHYVGPCLVAFAAGVISGVCTNSEARISHSPRDLSARIGTAPGLKRERIKHSRSTGERSYNQPLDIKPLPVHAHPHGPQSRKASKGSTKPRGVRFASNTMMEHDSNPRTNNILPSRSSEKPKGILRHSTNQVASKSLGQGQLSTNGVYTMISRERVSQRVLHELGKSFEATESHVIVQGRLDEKEVQHLANRTWALRCKLVFIQLWDFD